MTMPEEPEEWIDAEIVDGPAPDIRSSADKPKLLGPFAGINLRDDVAERTFLDGLRSMGVPISDKLMVENITAEFIPTQTHGPSQVDMLSKVLYDIAKIAEKVNMSIPVQELDELRVTEAMEEIIVKVARAPLAHPWELRLASGK